MASMKGLKSEKEWIYLQHPKVFSLVTVVTFNFLNEWKLSENGIIYGYFADIYQEDQLIGLD